MLFWKHWWMLKKNLLIIVVFLLIGCYGPELPNGDPTPDLAPPPAAIRMPEFTPSSEINQQAEPPLSNIASQEPPATLTTVPTAEPKGEPTVISADDTRIRYIGRFDFSDPGNVYFDWSGAAIEAAFSGSSLTILLKDSANFYEVSVDGQKRVLQTAVDKSAYQVVRNLANSSHAIRLTKRTEAYVGGATFSGFIVDAGHDLLPKPEAAKRQIEFIGDSITTGYGNEGESPTCWFTADTQNVTLTYAALTARQFDAEYSIVALSGLGVVRNLRADASSSAETAIDFVDRTIAMNPVLRWNPAEDAPDVVVVNLGTNDFSSLPFPDFDLFVEAYVNLLVRVRERYPRAPIVALSGPLMLDPAPSAVSTAVERMRLVHDDEQVHYVNIENNLDETGVDFGCDRHPNVQGHQKIADQLAPALADIMNW